MAEFTLPREDGIDWAVLGTVIDTSVGRSSTVKSPSYSVKITFRNDHQLLVSYMAVVNFGSENEKFAMKRRFETESIDVVNDILKKVKTEYKDVSGDSLKLKEVGTETWIEMIGLNPYQPRRTAYFRRRSVVEVSV